MACQETGAAVVKLAAEIDLTNSERACGQLDAAVACGAAVVREATAWLRGPGYRVQAG